MNKKKEETGENRGKTKGKKDICGKIYAPGP